MEKLAILMILIAKQSKKLQYVPDQVLFTYTIFKFYTLVLGGSIFTDVTADLFVTGEMGHHQVLELCDRHNSHVLLTEHSNCERGYLSEVFVPLLKKTLNHNSENSFEVLFSEVDVCDPLSVI